MSHSATKTETTIRVRVRYYECDPMGIAHHATYIGWLEMARTELLREQGMAYRDLEARGIFCVMVRLNVHYRRPVRYDEEIEIHVKALPTAGVKIQHEYEVKCDDELLVTAETTLACVDRESKLVAIPEGLRIGLES
ncbi:MAG: acyl-CoA thioesterase [Rhodospirillales bacterium]|nr:acyl-CoA thioesterase [Rhodospirillales bacterium]